MVLLGFICRQGPMRPKIEKGLSILKLFKEQKLLLHSDQPPPLFVILQQLKAIFPPLFCIQHEQCWRVALTECFIFQKL